MDKTQEILDQFPQVTRDVLIPMLQAVQDEVGFLSEEAIEKIGIHLKLPASKIYGLATFYNQFRFSPNGKYHIQVCNGSACHLDHSVSILKELHKLLDIGDGEITRDGMFSLEVLACIGACGQSPVIAINGVYYPKVKSRMIKDILETTKIQHS
jgi:NADH:ubiquinone oxidoreductase subunit E